MGAKLAHPEKLCINVWGDAAIGMTGMDFETARALRHPDPVDPVQQLLDGHGDTRSWPLSPRSTSPPTSRATTPSLASALGLFAERVTEPGQIMHALLRGIDATKAGSPALLEFITTPDKVYSTFSPDSYQRSR